MDVVRPILPSAPLLPLLAAFVAGMTCAWLWPGHMLYGAVLLAALSVFCALRRWRRCAVMGLFAVVGAGAMFVSMPASVAYDDEGAPQYYCGWAEEVRHFASSQRIVAEINADGRQAKVMINYLSDEPAVADGDSIRFKAAILPVGIGECVPGEMSMRGFALRRGIAARCDVAAGGLELAGGRRLSVAQHFAAMRSRLSDYIYYHSGLRQDAASMLDALITGNDGALGDDLRNDFTASGAVHVLALSGMHVGIIAVVIGLLLVPLRMIGGRRVKVEGALLMLLLWGYVFLTGCVPSVVRAAVMATCVLLGGILRRGSNPLNNLCAAALAILAADPLALFAPGFQLSFAAVAAIVLFAGELQPRGRLLPGVRRLLQWVVVSFAAVAGTGMLSAWHFHQFPIYFLLANAGIVLIVPWFMGLGLLLLALQSTPIPAGGLVDLVQMLYDWMEWVTGSVAAMPGAVANGIYFSAWLMAPYYAALWALWRALHTRRPVYLLYATLLAAFVAGALALPRRCEKGDEAYAVQSPFATTILLRHDSDAWLLTDAPTKFHAEMHDRYTRKLSVWMGARGIDSLRVTSLQRSDTLYAPGAFYACRSRWVIGENDMLVANAPADSVYSSAMAYGLCPRYVLVGRRFNGSVIDLAKKLNADTLVLSQSLHWSKIECYAEDLSEAGIPFVIGLSPRNLLEK